MTSSLSPTIASSTSMMLNRVNIIYLFINPISGGTAASEYLTLGLQYMKFRKDKLIDDTDVYIYDIREGVSGNKPPFIKLYQHINNTVLNNNPIRVIVAGGDGTIMWFLDEAIKHGINTDNIAIGVIPFGTANDFSRTLGWGSGPPRVIFGKHLYSFKNMIKEWCKAVIIPYDIWELEVKCTANGSIQQIKGSIKTPLKKDNSPEGEILRSIVKPICNYFSIGVESRVGLGFDKHRTKSKFLNKAVYVVEGTKKITFTKTPNIPSLIQCAKEADGNNDIIFTSKVNEDKAFKGKPVSIIMLNIPSIMGGCDLWSKCNKMGTINNDGDNTAVLEGQQDPGDGTFEMLSYNTLFALSAEQLRIPPFSGNGKRLYQGKGPIDICFKSNLNDSIKTYFQVDGEYFMCKHPNTMTIRHKTKIQVLKRQ